METLDDIFTWIDANKADLVIMSKVRSRANKYLEQARKAGKTPGLKKSKKPEVENKLSSLPAITKPEKNDKLVVKNEVALVNRQRAPKEYTQEDKDLAKLLTRLVIQNFPWFRKNNDTAQWSKHLTSNTYYMHRLACQGYDYQTIEAVIRFAQQDEFWKQNIMSGKKLFEQFDSLLSKLDTHVRGSRIEEIG